MARFILTAAETRAAEARAIEAGSSVERLMERAGRAVAEAALRLAGPVGALVLCGPGNNGGDGYVAACHLRASGVKVRVAALRPPRSDAARAAAEAWDGPIEALAGAAPAPLLIDGLFGTGLRRPLEPEIEAALARLAEAARLRVAIDLPSGVESDSGALLGAVPGFDLTVALGALKPAHRLLPAAACCGRVAVADIGLGAVESMLHEIGRLRLASPGPGDNKYTRGKLLVIGGAMPGAALLAAGAGQRAGAGYVELAGDGTDGPHALVRRGWSERLLDDPRVGAVVIGPGLGRDGDARARLDAAFASGRALVLDADALTLVGRVRHDRLKGHALTPHWGEFVRLFGDDGRDRLAQARAAAAACGAVVLLKGADSIVAHPDGRAAIAPLAPAWLASAGTGDVLAGIVGALLAGGRDAFAAAEGAVWLHAEAARLAGPMLIADDLVAALPRAAAACL